MYDLLLCTTLKSTLDSILNLLLLLLPHSSRFLLCLWGERADSRSRSQTNQGSFYRRGRQTRVQPFIEKKRNKRKKKNRLITVDFLEFYVVTVRVRCACACACLRVIGVK